MPQVDELSIKINHETDELEEFLAIVKYLLLTAEEVAGTLEKAGNHKESSKLYKSVMMLETYLNSDGDKKSTA
jgi:hypothetical protein